MTTPNDPFAERFGADGCRRFVGAPAVPGLPEAAALARIQGLVLPRQVGPYFHTLEDEPVALRDYAAAMGASLPSADQMSWARLGSDRAYDLVADPDGQVRALLIRYADEPLRYVNSSPEAFAESLLRLDELLDAITSTDDPAQASDTFFRFEERLKALDPRAFEDRESWWPLVLDDVRDTASVESYAAFEVLDDDGEKKIFTATGSICLHPEERVWSTLDAAGVQPEQVTRIYTELEACSMPGHYCSMWFALAFPNAAVTHSFPYGETAASRGEGMTQLRTALAQRAQGE